MKTLKLGGKMKIIPLDPNSKAIVKPSPLEVAQQACRNFADQPTKFGARRAYTALDNYFKSEGWAP
jgi:hypothetical protein